VTSARSSVGDCAVESGLARLTRGIGDSHRPRARMRDHRRHRCARRPVVDASAARRDLRSLTGEGVRRHLVRGGKTHICGRRSHGGIRVRFGLFAAIGRCRSRELVYLSDGRCRDPFAAIMLLGLDAILSGADRRSAERRAALPASAGGARGAGARHRLRLIETPAPRGTPRPTLVSGGSTTRLGAT
jgi:hypothetical protein